jgi:hypothetical protein
MSGRLDVLDATVREARRELLRVILQEQETIPGPGPKHGLLARTIVLEVRR